MTPDPCWLFSYVQKSIRWIRIKAITAISVLLAIDAKVVSDVAVRGRHLKTTWLSCVVTALDSKRRRKAMMRMKACKPVVGGGSGSRFRYINAGMIYGPFPFNALQKIYNQLFYTTAFKGQ